jgi:hypothetical protein
MLNESISLKGTLSIELFDGNGNLKEKRDLQNLVVSTGRNFVVSRLKDASLNPVSHIGVGTGGVAPDVSQTALTTQIGDRQAISNSTIVTTTTANDTLQFVANFPAGECTGPLIEAGLFNALTGGLMVCRAIFLVINKDVLDSMVVTWKLRAT